MTKALATVPSNIIPATQNLAEAAIDAEIIRLTEQQARLQRELARLQALKDRKANRLNQLQQTRNRATRQARSIDSILERAALVFQDPEKAIALFYNLAEMRVTYDGKLRQHWIAGVYDTIGTEFDVARALGPVKPDVSAHDVKTLMISLSALMIEEFWLKPRALYRKVREEFKRQEAKTGQRPEMVSIRMFPENVNLFEAGAAWARAKFIDEKLGHITQPPPPPVTWDDIRAMNTAPLLEQAAAPPPILQLPAEVKAALRAVKQRVA